MTGAAVKWLKALVLALGLALSAPVRAGEGLPGEPTPTAALAPTLFSAAWTATLGVDSAAEDPGEDVLVQRNRLDLDVQHPVSAALRVHLAGRLGHRASVGHRPGAWTPAWTSKGPDFGVRYDAVADLREANLRANWGALALTVGRDVVRWGGLELQSPFAVVCPMDFSQGLAGMLAAPDEPPLLPATMLRLEAPLGPGQLDALFLPFFEQHRFSPFATDAAMVRPGLGPELPAVLASQLRGMDLRLDRSLSESLMLALAPPSATPLDGSVGLRWSTQAGQADVALTALWLWDRMPELHLDPDLALLLSRSYAAGFDATKLVALYAEPDFAAAAARAKGKTWADLARATWHRRALLGGELQWEIADGWVVRADAAWTDQKVLLDTQFQPVLSGMVQAGAGLEHGVGGRVTLLGELTWDWAYGAPRDRTLLLAARHTLRLTAGALARLGEAEDWTAQIAGFYGISLRDWALAPRLTYQFAERWRAGLGAIVQGGPSNTLGGMLAADDQVLVELRRAW
ncbi:MAG: hypothetical protein HY902_21130 [Deltaproteobacteria bacterium]|nr:hypothetical protein [Deltaproteobacteria bacterium]